MAVGSVEVSSQALVVSTNCGLAKRNGRGLGGSMLSLYRRLIYSPTGTWKGDFRAEMQVVNVASLNNYNRSIDVLRDCNRQRVDL